MVYCSYTDQDLPNDKVNSEHIIPLSLGGVNGFEIPVCKKENSKLGSAIDGRIGQEFIIHSARTKHSIEGHSGKAARMYFNNAIDSESGQKVQLTISKNSGISAQLPYHNPDLAPPTGNSFSIPIKVDLDIWLKYTAKVFLAAGYYVYGQNFREGIDTNALRVVMRHSREEIIEKYTAEIKPIFNAHYIYQEHTSQFTHIFKAICRLFPDNSCVGFFLEWDAIHCFTSILGNYIGSISIEANTANFPKEGQFQQGHFLCVQDGKLKRVSYRHILLEIFSRLPENTRKKYPTPY
ncbi:HNH endonuclease [Thalassospira povalilytica]|uniref:HNH endonuclease 5 domain-containing protein n=1 Tax=Thalassospira povalilytica TaxID=732237 RepID=A0A8I1M863_9PROT|nr:HNH endonuclease [Thalassospira povalilytica]MBN8196878.1 hypothetical protein [Thalassospira povalilytica]